MVVFELPKLQDGRSSLPEIQGLARASIDRSSHIPSCYDLALSISAGLAARFAWLSRAYLSLLMLGKYYRIRNLVLWAARARGQRPSSYICTLINHAVDELVVMLRCICY